MSLKQIVTKFTQLQSGTIWRGSIALTRPGQQKKLGPGGLITGMEAVILDMEATNTMGAGAQ